MMPLPMCLDLIFHKHLLFLQLAGGSPVDRKYSRLVNRRNQRVPGNTADLLTDGTCGCPEIQKTC